MKRILMISGPALGHVARLTLVAEALKSAVECRIDFIVADFCQHKVLPETVGCNVIPIHIPEADRSAPAITFAREIENVFKNHPPDLVVQDCNPLRWLVASHFPDCPRVVITNAFLTDLAGFETHQTAELERKRNIIDRIRAGRGLKRLGTAYDLYKGDKTLLADPAPIAELFTPWPDHVSQTGPLCMDTEGYLPEALKDETELILFSMGSTGGLVSYVPTAKQMKQTGNLGPLVYVGSQFEAARQSEAFDYCFDWLPLSPVLERTSSVVSHGGTGSTYLALSKGVPVMVSPKHANHALLADCLTRLGVGGYLEADPTLSKIEVMRRVLGNDKSRFNHAAAPTSHASAILEML